MWASTALLSMRALHDAHGREHRLSLAHALLARLRGLRSVLRRPR